MTDSDHELEQQRLHDEILDSLDEEFEAELEDALMERATPREEISEEGRMPRRVYFRELLRLQRELIKLQSWVVETKAKVAVFFEGRDAAGKGGAIKRITQRLNPRVCRVVALPAPNQREKTQWYFQRYIRHLPAGGEIVLFDRSWYNRAGVERVMGFCNDQQLQEFFQTVPELERMLVTSGMYLIKYWFSISDHEQRFRFQCRIDDPLKQWKLSPMDLEARRRWEQYTRAKEEMFARTNISEAPWWVVEADDKKRARLNCIHHFLQQIPYAEVPNQPISLPPREHAEGYQRKSLPEDVFVPSVY
ncbi:polyphosphate kinase 2 [Bremerella cremea]|uniref:polyphosphate kinase 2 n=1 Tax=Bremerella cremea TaxID=1031537 RepID=UPI0031EB1EAF